MEVSSLWVWPRYRPGLVPAQARQAAVLPVAATGSLAPPAPGPPEALSFGFRYGMSVELAGFVKLGAVVHLVERQVVDALAELHPRATRMVAAEFLQRVLEKLPYKAHAVLTDNEIQFTPQAHQWFPGGYSIDRICRAFGVEHRLTKPAHPRGPTARLSA